MFARMSARLFLALPLALTIACGGDDDDDDDNGADAAVDIDASASCVEAMSHSDLPWIQENIFTPSCAAFTACHRGTAAQAAMLNLEDGNSESNLVDRFARSEGIDSADCVPLGETDCNASEICVWNPDGAGSCEGLTLVKAGDSANSYLMVLIDSEERGGRLTGPLPTAGTMPFNNPLMCEEKRDAVARWIDSL